MRVRAASAIAAVAEKLLLPFSLKFPASIDINFLACKINR